MKRLAISAGVGIFIVAVVLVAILFTEDVASPSPGEPVASACVDCHTDIELLEAIADVPEDVEEPEEPAGEG
jgi:hypothetical protein